MSPNLVILCLAAFAIVSMIASSLVALALPWLDRLADRLSARHRARLWLGLAALPGLVAAFAVGASFLPALGLGHDHCLAHGPHHPHLCPHHVGGAPGIVLVFGTVVFAARVAHTLFAFVGQLRVSRGTARTLGQACERREDVLVFPSEKPQAFVLGMLRPRVFVSGSLLALGEDIVEPILAHERVHARRRDLVWRALCPVLSLGHLPPARSALFARLTAAQELAADEEGATTLRDGRPRMAQALLALARVSQAPVPGISFAGGDLTARVLALLGSHPTRAAWPARLFLAGALSVPMLLAASHDFVHHGLETLLGALS